MITKEKYPMSLVFRPLRLEDRATVEGIRALEGHSLSAHAFASLFLWQDAMKLSCSLRERAFLVRFEARGENAYFFPCGSAAEKLELLREVAKLPDLSLYYLREEDKDFLSFHLPGCFVFEEMRGDSEYLYLLRDQLNLSGGAYKNLRSKIHKARNRYDWEVLDLEPKCLERAAAVIRGWHGGGGSEGDRNVALRALEHFDCMGFQGILLENAEGPQAVALGSLITSDTFDLHVTKSLQPNIDSYLKWELFRRIPPFVKWINQEEDLNLPGLRTNKLESLPRAIAPLWKGTAI